MAAPIRPPRKHCFFIKITISQYHDIDISYIDIDIGKNAFSMTSLQSAGETPTAYCLWAVPETDVVWKTELCVLKVFGLLQY